MYRLLLLIFVFSAFISTAQKNRPVFASVPLGEKSVGKHFDRSKIAAAVPTSNFEGKYILVDVFFQACGPCRASIPYLNEMSDSSKYPQLQVISIDPFKEDSATMDKFISHFKIEYPVVAGKPALDIWSMVGNNGYPFAFLIDPSGKIVAVESGFSKEGFKNFQRKVR